MFKIPKSILYILPTLIILVSCSFFGGKVSIETPDIQATVEEAIKATKAVEEATASPTPLKETEVPEEYIELTEEELAQIVTQAIEDSQAASEEASQAIVEATQDNVITEEEAEAIAVYIYDADAAVALSEELINAYYFMYEEFAEETVALLREIERDLEEMIAITDELVDILNEIENTLDAGLEVALETIEQLEDVAAQIQDKVGDLQDKTRTWFDERQVEIQNKVNSISKIEPSAIAGNRREAIESAFAYLDAVRSSLLDDRLTNQELSNIAQLGANAMASLKAHGGSRLSDLSFNIGEITNLLAFGQFPDVRGGLGILEKSLGPRQ